MADADRGADSSLREVGPIDATAARVQRINEAGIAAHKNATARDRRLAVSMNAVRKSESPLQLQLRDVACGKAGGFRGLETGIGDIDAPAVLCGAGERISEIGTRRTMIRHRLSVSGLGAPERPATQINRNQALFSIAQAFHLHGHRPARESRQNRLRCHLHKGLLAGRLRRFIGILVAGRTVLDEKTLALQGRSRDFFLLRMPRKSTEEKHQEANTSQNHVLPFHSKVLSN
jgi:hypothetical protein